MKPVVLLSFLFYVVGLSAQNTSFYKIFSGVGYDKGEGIIQLSDSSYIVVGSSSSFEEAPSQGFLLHLDKTGNYLWSKDFGGSESEEAKRVMAIENDGFYVAGTSNSGSSQDYDFWLTKTDLSGNVFWEQHVDLGNWERTHDALLLADSSIVLVGETNNTSNENTDMAMVRFSKDGTLLWTKQWGTGQEDRLTAIIAISDSSFMVTGTKYVADSLMNKAYFAAFEWDNTLIWETTGGGYGTYQMNELLMDVNGGIRACGQRQIGSSEFLNFSHLGLNFAGVINHEYSATDASTSRVTAFAQYDLDGDQKFIVSTGIINASFPTFADGEDMFLIRYGNSFYWDGYGSGYSSFKQDQCNEVIRTLDDMVIAVGFHSNFGSGGASLFVIKIGDDNNFPQLVGNPTIYGLVELSESFESMGYTVYPNPFTDVLTLNGMKGTEEVTILDQQGKMVFHSLPETAGKWMISLPELAQGIYTLTISGEKGIAQTKIIK